MPSITMQLAGALNNLNSAAGGLFAIGGTSSNGYLFGSSNGLNAATLSLTVAAVPVPAALPLMVLAFGAMGVAARRRKSVA